MTLDYRVYNELENYIRGHVHDDFHKHGFLCADDFFCIIIWKANRAKSRIAFNLLKENDDLEICCRQVTEQIFQSTSHKERLHILLEKYHFRLPMASAILSVLYPDEFSIYDYRVCETLIEYKYLSNQENFEKIWEGYLLFIKAIKKLTPTDMSLVDKDHYLWGKSFYINLLNDIKLKFKKQ